MIQINQSPSHDGYTFSLDPRSASTLHSQRPDARLLRRLFIAFASVSDFQSGRGDLYQQVAQLLTGLSEEQLSTLGGYTIVDPVTNNTLFPDA